MKQIIKPRILPRDVIDVLIGIPIGLYQVIIFLGVPSIAIGFLTHSFAIGFFAYCLLYCFYLLFMVRKITIDENGIMFHRVLGTPKKLNWQEIETIVEVSRSELLFKGWLCIPPRELTLSLSAKQHFRIKWRSGFCYFPPKETSVFEEIVKQYIDRKTNKSLEQTA